MSLRRSVRLRLAPALALLLCGALGLTALVGGCNASAHPRELNAGTAVEGPSGTAPEARRPGGVLPRRAPFDRFLDDVQHRTFRWFWETTNPANGLVPDRWPNVSFSSIAAVGFGLASWPIGAERGWITRDQARERTLTTLRFLWNAPQGDAASGTAGYKGFFYHFVHMEDGTRFETVELSTIDTALLLAGALVAQGYFDRDDPAEAEIRRLVEDLYARVDWTWAQPRPPLLGHGWRPEGGLLPLDWRGYDESMILYVLALGSPTHPIAPAAWPEFTRTYRFERHYGQEYVAFAPLFGHQYSQIFVDFRGIRDEFMRARGLDYFENSRRASLAHQAYAIANPLGWEGYGAKVWGLTACDGPVHALLDYKGQPRQFHTYSARGTGVDYTLDDGTIAPTAAGGAVPFAPEIAIPALKEMKSRWGRWLYTRYGFLDAFNPSFRYEDVTLQHGRLEPGIGWFDSDYIGIDQGPILLQLENYRNGFVWRMIRKSPHVVRGLQRAGFTGGWLGSGGAP